MLNRIYNFNFGWKFHEGDFDKSYDVVGAGVYDEPQWLKAGNNGIAIKNLDDSDWQNIKLPHDFVIEKCEFTADVSPNIGSLRKNIAWYRKTFTLPQEIKDKRIFIKFDGVFRDSQVWCNGHFMGRHLGGYMGFSYELTEVLDKNGPNTIAVCADARGSEGWWYEGGGIYRDAYLVATPSVRIVENGVFVKPYNINIEQRTCDLELEMSFNSNKFEPVNVNYTTEIYDNTGKLIVTAEGKTAIDTLGEKAVKQNLSLQNVNFWDVENTNIYTADVTVECGSESDTFNQKFAVREIKYTPEKGMTINNEPTFMKGVCGHDDFAGVGVAMNKAVMQFKVEKLKEMGCNAYRCSHNPPSPVFLDICDELGMFVLDETRLPGTSREMEEDFIDLIKRDRNHPCVVFFSMGNEEMNIQHTRIGTNIFSKMQAIGKKYDDSRDYLYAINGDKNANVDFIEGDGLHLPVHGVNYVTNRYKPCFDWLIERHPTCCFISTESTGTASIRGYKMDQLKRPAISEAALDKGVWANEENKGILTCYGDFTPVWSFTPELSLQEHRTKPYMLGDFLWTGFDYRGEVFPYVFPQVVSSYGIIDLCGFYKDWAYHVKAWWGNEPVLHILPSWNLPEPEGTIIPVWVFTNCDNVELILNGNSLGKKTVEPFSYVEWQVPYEKGTLEAIGYKGGVQILSDKVTTAQAEHQIILKTEKPIILANADDSTIITVEVADKNGNLVANSVLEIDFEIAGVGKIKGVGNGDPSSLEHDKKPKRKLFAGKAMVIVEGTFEAGDITLKASANSIKTAEITINSSQTEINDYIFATEDVDYGSFRVKIVDL